MLQDLNRTVEALLQLELPALFAQNGGTQVTVSFATPNNESIKQKPAINFFLYDVRENVELRSTGYSVERQSNGTAIKKRPPVRVDCSYLITIWPIDETDNQTEHRLLGEVMKVLLRYRQIPEAAIQGSLKGQEPPLRAIGLHPSNLQSLGEFWQAMGGKPKAALNYTLTIAVPVYEDVDAGSLVVDKRLELKQII